jgi:CheY-like chemotaxis protein
MIPGHSRRVSRRASRAPMLMASARTRPMPVEDCPEVAATQEMVANLIVSSQPSRRGQNVPGGASDVWILIADDEPDMLRLVRFRLERCGWQILVARDGIEALDCVQTTHPDVCLLDIVMPRANGFDVLEALRADTDTADTKVIKLTARASDDDIARSYHLGADDYIAKP